MSTHAKPDLATALISVGIELDPQLLLVQCTRVIISLRGSASDIFRILWTSIWNCWQAPTSWLGTTLWLGSPPQGKARCISTSCLWCVALGLLWGLKILRSTKKSCIHTMQVFLLLLIKVDITTDIDNNSNTFTKLILNWCFHWPVQCLINQYVNYHNSEHLANQKIPSVISWLARASPIQKKSPTTHLSVDKVTNYQATTAATSF